MTGLSDIFEKILITVFQSGFRRGRSTLDHLIRFESFIRETFIKSEHRIAVFFYLKKAYDTTCIEVRYFERLALFSIKINNIVKCVQPGVKGSLYVDDFFISHSARNIRPIERQLEQCC
jgi:hypothetical protein